MQETRARLSEQLAGVPKAPEHTAAIAASQRRRHAAARILKAVESVHAAAAAPASTHLPLARTGGIGGGVLAGGTLGRGPGGKRASERASRTATRAAVAALDAYKVCGSCTALVVDVRKSTAACRARNVGQDVML